MSYILIHICNSVLCVVIMCIIMFVLFWSYDHMVKIKAYLLTGTKCVHLESPANVATNNIALSLA